MVKPNNELSPEARKNVLALLVKSVSRIEQQEKKDKPA